jgi:hemerythrin superfamily protein
MPTTKTRSTRSRRKSSDAIAVLKGDHREVEDLFKKFDGLGPDAHKTRESTVARIIEGLSRHAAIEELILYPEVRERSQDDEDLVLEALEEHHIVKWTLSELEAMASEDERFTAKVTVLMESVRHHVKEEEGELFPKVRDLFSRAELNDMGRRLADAKKAAPSRPHPRSPDEPPANLVSTAVTAPLDASAKLARSAAKAVRRTAG